MKPRWTPEEDSFIVDNFGVMTAREMSAVLGRTEGAIGSRRLRVGAPNEFRWTPEEDSFIVDNFGVMTAREMSAVLGRTVGAIRNRRLYIGASKRFRWDDVSVQMVMDAYRGRVGKDTVDIACLARKIGCSEITVSRKARELGLTRSTGFEPKNGYTDSGKRRDKPLMFRSDEDRRRHKSETQKAWIKKNGHPKGASGMRHTDDTKRAISEKSKAQWASLGPEDMSKRMGKLRETKRKNMMSGKVPPRSGNPYSRTRSGIREDIGPMRFRSSWEANYARYLNMLIETGDIVSWVYEPERFFFSGYKIGAMSYLPDFKVVYPDGSFSFHEVKGWMDGPSKTRLKRMAKQYPDVTVNVVDANAYRVLDKEYRDIIANWETPTAKDKCGTMEGRRL